MKSLKALIAVSIFSFIAVSCKNEGPAMTTEITQTEKTATADTNLKIEANSKAEFTIEGMTCAMGCAKKIENKLAETEGVTSAIVDFDKKLAMVEFDTNKLTTASLEEIVKSAGESYSVSDMKTMESFSSNQAKHECNEACVKEGCTAEKKKACGDNCKKACCAKKA